MHRPLPAAVETAAWLPGGEGALAWASGCLGSRSQRLPCLPPNTRAWPFSEILWLAEKAKPSSPFHVLCLCPELGAVWRAPLVSHRPCLSLSLSLPGVRLNLLPSGSISIKWGHHYYPTNTFHLQSIYSIYSLCDISMLPYRINITYIVGVRIYVGAYIHSHTIHVCVYVYAMSYMHL